MAISWEYTPRGTVLDKDFNIIVTLYKVIREVTSQLRDTPSSLKSAVINKIKDLPARNVSSVREIVVIYNECIT